LKPPFLFIVRINVRIVKLFLAERLAELPGGLIPTNSARLKFMLKPILLEAAQ